MTENEKDITNTDEPSAASSLPDNTENESDVSRFIRALEKKGTEELAKSSCLPTIGLNPHWAHFCGIEIISEVISDPLFVNVKLPEGWKVKTTNHNYWCELFDNKNRLRALIFYKAAPHDRRAQMQAVRRFYTRTNKIDKGYIGEVTDCDKVIWTGEAKETMFESEAEAIEWLADNYPKYNSVYNYWD